MLDFRAMRHRLNGLLAMALIVVASLVIDAQTFVTEAQGAAERPQSLT